MGQYMIDIQLPYLMSAEFLALIPKQRAQINSLMQQGLVTNYLLAIDRSRLWTVIEAESEAEIWEILETFPIYPHVECNVYELMFHNHIAHTLPAISLN